MTRYVIHNHLPARRAKDEKPKQKPYIGKAGNTWELNDMFGKVIAKASNMEQLKAGLDKELAKYRSQVDSRDADPDLGRFSAAQLTGRVNYTARMYNEAKAARNSPEAAKWLAAHTAAKAEQAKRQNTAPYRGQQDANTAYDIKVRHISTGADYNIRIFAASQEAAEQRAKIRASRMERISPAKLSELERSGVGVFRIVSSKVSNNQQPYQGDARDDANLYKVKIHAVQTKTSSGWRSGAMNFSLSVRANSSGEAKQQAEAQARRDHPGAIITVEGVTKVKGMSDHQNDMHPDEIKDRMKEVQEQMDRIIRSGGRIPMNDPLMSRFRVLKQELARARSSEQRDSRDPNTEAANAFLKRLAAQYMKDAREAEEKGDAKGAAYYKKLAEWTLREVKDAKKNVFEHAVPREQEEKNRDRMYRDAGITRV